MLKIFNDLSPFFEDCYRKINVREYSRIKKISPPTASKMLKEYKKKKLLKKEKEKIYDFYYANKESELFKDLMILYWKQKLEKAGLIKEIENVFLNPVIYLFGSATKAELTKKSDIDIAIFTNFKNSEKIRKINIKKIEKKIKRKIQLFYFKDLKELDENLLKNILNGYKIKGVW